MQLTSLRELFVHELRDLRSAETQMLEALPQMIEQSENAELRSAFEHHKVETQRHVDRLEEILGSLGEDSNNHTCKGMKGLIAEGKDMLDERGNVDVRDAGIISSAQRIEHYEIAGYGSLIAYARLLEEERAAELLGLTLQEEEAAADKLTAISERAVNPRATQSLAQA